MGGFLDSEEEAFADGMALTKSYVSLNSIIIKNKSADYPDSAGRRNSGRADYAQGNTGR